LRHIRHLGILELQEVGAGLGTGLFRLKLHDVAQRPGNGWRWLHQLLLPIEADASPISAVAAN